MSTDFILALQITAIGMGLVFAAIVLLWGVMAALVRLAVDPPEEPEEAEAESEAPAGAPALVEAGPAVDRKPLAAAIAVATALAQQSNANEPHEFPLPPTSLVSAWQAVMRTRILNKRGSTR